ncbi:MAG: hypothetical protein ACT4NY_02200 [Pseudonocardiales bacterium]
MTTHRTEFITPGRELRKNTGTRTPRTQALTTGNQLPITTSRHQIPTTGQLDITQPHTHPPTTPSNRTTSIDLQKSESRATTWSDSNKFYAALRRDRGATSHDSTGAWIEPVPLGRTALPGIAAVHGIVLTTDDQVLLTQRSTKVDYAPLHWSASFEEQLNELDFGADEDPFTHAARRGFYEEFAADIDPTRISALSALLQLDLLNLSMVMLLRPGLTAAQIEEHWTNQAQDGWEAERLGWLPCESLHQLIRRNDFSPLHSTSRLRCELLRRWIQENPVN